MADLGVKKIKWDCVGEGKVILNLSIPNEALVIRPNQKVGFVIAEWFPGTQESHMEKGIVWILQDENRFIIKQESRQDYKKKYYIEIPPKLCGIKHYYLEASLSGTRDLKNKTGLKVRGYCLPKITGSAWKDSADGEDIRKSHQFSYGDAVYLNLQTEGINGYKNIKIDIYRQVEGGGGLDDDQYIKSIIVTDPVKDGEINLKISNTSTWWAEVSKKKNISRNPNGAELFYVRVSYKLRTGKYADINDGKNVVHARYLRMKNTLTIQKPEPPSNITPTKVNEPEYNLTKAEPCTFKKIIAYEGNEPKNIFDEEKLKKLRTDNETFLTIRNIYYDFDKYDIRKDAIPVLDEIVKFLLETPYLPIEVGSHTDIRGTDEYNLTLSQKRAQSVVEYFVSRGLSPERVKARGYGKQKLLYPGTGISEELHQKNRRSTLEFKVYGSNAREIVLDVLAPTSEKPKEFKLKVEQRDNVKCKKTKDQHSRLKKIKEYSHLYTGKESTQDTDLIKYPVYSPLQDDFPRNYMVPLLGYLLPGKDYANHFYFYINSCAYYFSKNQPTVHLKVYPDIIWIGHFQYNFYEINKDESKGAKKDFFFHNHKVELTNGITEVVEELSKKISNSLFNIIPKSWLSDNVLANYIKGLAEDYDYGFHAIHNRQLEKPGEALILKGKETNFLKDTNYSRFAAAYVIYLLVVVQIIIELLLIYLTRGRNLKGKIAKLAKRAKRVKEFMDDNNITLIAPSIAVNAGMYYYTQKDLRMALVYELNIKADPLVKVNFTQDFDLLNGFLDKSGKKGNQTVADALKKAGITTLKGTFDVSGDIKFEEQVQFNMLTNTYTLGEKMQNLIALRKFERVVQEDIKAEITLDLKYNKEFKFLRIRTDIEGKVKLYMRGGAKVKIKYGVSPEKGLFMEYILVFSGIQGTFTGNIKTDNDIFGTKEKKLKPIPFTLLEAKEYTLSKIYLFDPNP